MGLFDFNGAELLDENVSIEELKNNESLKNMNIKNRRRQILRTVFYVLIAVLLLAGAFAAGVALLFRLRTVEVTGNERYLTDEMIEASGLRTNSNLLFISTAEAEQNISEAFPYIRKVSVTKNYPDGVSITVEEDTAKWYGKIWDQWFILTADLRVMEKIPGPEAAEQYEGARLKRIRLPEVNYAVVGEKLVFGSATAYDYTVKFLDEISALDIFGRLEFIDVGNRYHIALYMNDHRYKLLIGDSDAVEAKIRLIEKIISDSDDIEQITIASFNAEYVNPIIYRKESELYSYD
ncbi:MAG: FtsQ-type POTRA domain-containing protein [Clostridia bacterium]|nr:FtsQ-type POTRA domain-containing protein [Clostridia bacterium]